MLPLIRPDVSFADVDSDVEAILASGRLTSGPYVAAFEDAIASTVGTTDAIATTSATTALHLALAAHGVGPGDEVLVSDFTFPASGNVIVQLGAVPVLVDSRRDGFDLDPQDLSDKLTGRTKAVMVVHPFGQPADLDAIATIVDAVRVPVVEDAACALGSSRREVSCGSRFTGCFSFHPRKVVTTGEGGAITTSDPELVDRLRLLRNHGGRMGDAGMEFIENGYNYRLSEIPAALGLAQFRRIDEIIADRRRTAHRYEKRLVDVAGVTLRTPPSDARWSYQSFVVMLDAGIDRDAVIVSLRGAGIETTLGTYALHAQPAFSRFGYRPGELPNSWAAQQHSLTLPIVPRMSEGTVERVVESLVKAVAGNVR